MFLRGFLYSGSPFDCIVSSYNACCTHISEIPFKASGGEYLILSRLNSGGVFKGTMYSASSSFDDSGEIRPEYPYKAVQVIPNRLCKAKVCLTGYHAPAA